jgi:hypothetical protein
MPVLGLFDAEIFLPGYAGMDSTINLPFPSYLSALRRFLVFETRPWK